MAARNRIAAIFCSLLITLCWLCPVQAAMQIDMDEPDIPVVYSFEELLVFLGREDLIPSGECDCDDDCDCEGECVCEPGESDDSWPCGCEYWCADGCACGDECVCPNDCYCDCNSADPWPCGCEYWCADGCACGDECVCPDDCYCDCNIPDEPPPAEPPPDEPSRGDTVRFGTDIIADFDPNSFLSLEGIHILAGEYGLVLRQGILSIRGGSSVTGEGVGSPVVTVESGGDFSMVDSTVTATGRDGSGGTAILLEDGAGFLPGDSVVYSSGAGAVGVRAIGSLALNMDVGQDYGEFITVCTPFGVHVDGTDSIAIHADGDVSLRYCELSATGEAIRADGNILLDTCVVSPAVADAQIVRRTIKEVGSFASCSFFLNPGEELIDTIRGQNPFDTEFEAAFIAYAPGAEDLWVLLRYRLGEAEMDLDTPGSYFVPIIPSPPYNQYSLIGDSPLMAAIYVLHPDIPYFADAQAIEDENGKYVSLLLTGRELDTELHTLMVSPDDGETWEPYPWENTMEIMGYNILIPVESEGIHATFSIRSAAGGSNRIRIAIDENGYFSSGPPSGDRSGGDREEPPSPPVEPGGDTPSKPGGDTPSKPSKDSGKDDRDHSTGRSAPGRGEQFLPATAGDVVNETMAASAPVAAAIPAAVTLTQALDAKPSAPPAEGFDERTVTVSGERLAVMIAANPGYVPFLRGELRAMLPASYLESLSLSPTDTFTVTLYQPDKHSFTVAFAVNNTELTDPLDEPFLVSLPWSGGPVSCATGSGEAVNASLSDSRAEFALQLAGTYSLTEQTEENPLPEPSVSSEANSAPEPEPQPYTDGWMPIAVAGVVSLGGVAAFIGFTRKRR